MTTSETQNVEIRSTTKKLSALLLALSHQQRTSIFHSEFMIRGIRDLWKRYRGFGNDELETLKRSTIELKAEVERLRASAAARRQALEAAALAEARAAAAARQAAAEAVEGAEKILESAGLTAEKDLEAMVRERAAQVVAEGEEALERVMLAEMMKAEEAERKAAGATEASSSSDKETKR